MAYHCDCVYTNTPSAGGFRGWGGPQVMTAIETHMDFVARKRGVDPLKLRLYNLVEPGDTDPLTGLSLGNAHVRDCVIQGARAFGWEAVSYTHLDVYKRQTKMIIRRFALSL